MNMKMITALALAAALTAQTDAWSRVVDLTPGADIRIVAGAASFRGAFLGANDERVTILLGEKRSETIGRDQIRSIALNRGTHHRKRNFLIAFLAAGAVAELKCAGKGPACMEASPLTFYSVFGVGSLFAATVDSGDWMEIYRVT